MYQVPPHHTPATVGHIAALVVAAVMFLVLAMSLPVERAGGEPVPLPQHAPAGLDL
jgi:hypothetical protein